MLLSVITPSVRPEGLKLVEKALNRQTFRDFEWIVQGREKPLSKGEVWSLNRDYNCAIRKSRGDLIVSWQDWTHAKPDCLERFVQHFKDEPKTLVTGVGNKYTDETWMVVSWQDPRKRSDQGSYYQCFFNDIEWNLCSVPREAIYAVGGFDESLDKLGYGMDGFSVVDRINLLGGYDFKIDQGIESFSLEHGRLPEWDEKNLVNKYQPIHKGYVDNPTLNFLP